MQKITLSIIALFLFASMNCLTTTGMAWADDDDDYANESDQADVQVDVDTSSSKSSAAATKEVEEVGGLSVQVVDSEMKAAKEDELDLGFNADGVDNFLQGDATFEGMVFEIYDEEDQLVTKIKADETGLAALDEKHYLPLGTYTVKQDANSANELGYHENEKWSKKGKKVIVDIPDAVVESDPCECEPIRGAVRINRVDGELYDLAGIDGVGQGAAILSEAVYQVYNASASTVIVDGVAYKPFDESLEPEITEEEAEAEEDSAEEEVIDYDDGVERNRPIMEITTDEFGMAVAGEEYGPYDTVTGLPWGTYIFKEKKASEGYRKDRALTVNAVVRGEECFDADDVARANPIHGGLKLSMVDGETEDGSPQGDATLKGAVFEIVNNSGENCSVVVDGMIYNNGDVVKKIKTNKKGVASCDKKLLPYGKYKVRMCKDKGTKCYTYDKSWGTSINVKKNGKRATTKKKKPYKAKAVRGGVSVKELEAQTNEPIEDATIEVVNASKAPVIVEGNSYAVGQTVLTITSDEDGVAKSGKDILPYGTYTLRETVPSEGYELNKDWNPKFEVRKASKVVKVDNVFSTPSSDVVQTSAERPPIANTILPFVAIAAAIVIIATIAIVITRQRRASRARETEFASRMTGNTPSGMRKAKADNTPSGMRKAKAGKTYIEAANEARQNVARQKAASQSAAGSSATIQNDARIGATGQGIAGGKTYEELSRSAYGAAVNDSRKKPGHIKKGTGAAKPGSALTGSASRGSHSRRP